MEDFPEYRFVCSAAQHLAWIEERYPELFARITERVRTGQFVPVGGMWVEADCNLASGEALVRQIVFGQRYFADRFGDRLPGAVAPRRLRLHRRPPPDHGRRRHRLVRLPEAVVERDQPLPPPHVLVGGHRRHPGAGPLPAGRHLQRRHVAAAAVPQRPGGPLHLPLRPRRRRRRPDPGDAGGGPAGRRPRRLPRPWPSSRRRPSSPPSKPTRRRCRYGSATSTSRSTGGRSPARPASSGATARARRRCRRRSCGRPPPGPGGTRRRLRSPPSWRPPGGCCSPTSSTTSFPARRSAGWPRRPKPSWPTSSGGPAPWPAPRSTASPPRSTPRGLAEPVVVFNPTPFRRREVVEVGGRPRLVDVPPLGWTTIDAAGPRPVPPPTPVEVGDGWMDNGRLRLEWDGDGPPHPGLRCRPRPGGPGRRRLRQPVPAPRGPAPRLRRLGRRPRLPRPDHRPRRRRPHRPGGDRHLRGSPAGCGERCGSAAPSAPR